MPMPPALISFSAAVRMTAERTGWSIERSFKAVIDGCCDGAFEAWGHDINSMPRLIRVQRWNEFLYVGTELPYSIENIELMTVDFLKWLTPELLNRPAGNEPSEAASYSDPVNRETPAAASNPTSSAVIEKVGGKAGRIMAAMRAMPREELVSMLGKTMEDTFKASRTYCTDLRKKVLKETVSPTLSPIDK